MGPIDAQRMAGVDPDRWMQDMQAKVADLSVKTAELQENLAHSSATAKSKDHAVQVTIAPTGALQSLELTDRAAGMSPQRLQASIMEAVGRAQRAASEKMIEAFQPLGAGTESMNMVLSFLPPAVDDEDDERDPYADAVDEYEPPAPPVRPEAPAPPPARRPRPVNDDMDEDNNPW
ncbi:YbaB/EbfC family nucleoid-associated protein [Lentzea sp. NPDC051213]|uniref:YbaB/EbfC family nucleoid-associated protein n=1 Tax=Lentzea sp. NPDC051213 TaxID=3364126 RepID=UPI00379F40F9